MDPLDPLKKADSILKKMAEEKQRAKLEAERNALIQGVAENIPYMMEPLLHKVSENARFHTEQVVDAIKGIQIAPPDVNVQVDTPKAEVSVSQEKIEIPEIKTDGIVSAIKEAFKGLTFPKPEVTVEATKIPEFPKFPDFPAFPDAVALKGITPKQPLPVQMVDMAGKPFFPQGGGVGGGRADFFTIKDIQASSGASIIDQATGALKVTGDFSITSSATSTLAQLVDSDGNGYSSTNPLQIAGSISTTPGATFYASDAVGSVNVIQSITLETRQVSGGIDSVIVNEIFGTTGTNVFNPDNRLKVELPTGSSGLTDTELRATAVPVSQVSGASFSVSVNDVFGSVAANVVNPDGRLKVELPTGSSGLTDTELRASHLDVQQLSGSIDSVYLTGVFGTVGVVTIDPDGNPKYSSASSGLTDTELRASSVPVEQVSGSSWSVSATQSGTWNITTLTGITNSLSVNVADSSGVAYSGSNPLPVSATGTVAVSGITGSIGATILNGEGVARDTWGSSQVGTWNITTLTGVTNSVAIVSLDRDGNPLTTGPIGNGDESTALRIVQAGNSVSSVIVNSGTITAVTGITNSVATALVDSTGVAYSGSNPVPITWVSGAGVSTAVNISDSSGVGYSGSNPFPVTGTVVVSSVTATTGSAIVDSSGVMYGSANPMHIAVHDSFGSTITSFGSGDSKGLAVAIVDASGNQITSFGGGTQYAEGATASTYTGTAMIFAEASSDAAKVVSSVDPLPATLATALSSSIDSILARPVSLRGNLSTAYATLNTNTETTLLSASAGNFLDLVWIKFANTSSGAVTIDLRDVSAGNIVDTYEVPANGVVGISMAVPYPQGNQGNAWTVDYNDSDLSNTTVYVSGMFHKTT